MFPRLQCALIATILACVASCSRAANAPLSVDDEAAGTAVCLSQPNANLAYCECFVSNLKSRVSSDQFRYVIAGMAKVTGIVSRDDLYRAWDRLDLSEEDSGVALSGAQSAVAVCVSLL